MNALYKCSYLHRIMRDKIIIITQYYLVKSEDDEYRMKRQKEVDLCLEKNIENDAVDEIHLLVEKNYDLSFIKTRNVDKVKQVVIYTRLTYEIAFSYYNESIPGTYAVLLNADIYTNDSLSIIHDINFNDFDIFIALNRYEDNADGHALLLNGLMENCQGPTKADYLEPYDPSIWSQDGWIWKSESLIIPKNTNFRLGITGCDNLIARLFIDAGYHVINPSWLICLNHYDLLSIEVNEYGVTKGNVSKKKEDRLGNMETYTFLKNIHDIPDIYTTNMRITVPNEKFPFIKSAEFDKTITVVEFTQNQVTIINNGNERKYVEVDFYGDLVWIAAMDIGSRVISRLDMQYGYLSKLNIYYIDKNNEVIRIPGSITGIQSKNGGYIKKIYFKEIVLCKKIRVYIQEIVGIPEIQIKLYRCNETHWIQQTSIGNHSMVYYDRHWSHATPTEKQVFQLFSKSLELPCNYFAFPWSTLYDNRYKNCKSLETIIEQFLMYSHDKNGNNEEYFTVALHESFVEFMEIFKRLNIKYIFASQKNKNHYELELQYDIRIIPFSLYPAQCSNADIIPIRDRRLLTNFIGQYDPNCYISDIRMNIFTHFSKYSDCTIVRRDKWHYQNCIYGNNKYSNTNNENEYKDAIINSKYTLCPSGSGPNSIRIWEAMSYGSIPVILADTLVLP